jgi:hypothetical protein
MPVRCREENASASGSLSQRTNRASRRTRRRLDDAPQLGRVDAGGLSLHQPFTDGVHEADGAVKRGGPVVPGVRGQVCQPTAGGAKRIESLGRLKVRAKRFDVDEGRIHGSFSRGPWAASLSTR